MAAPVTPRDSAKDTNTSARLHQPRRKIIVDRAYQYRSIFPIFVYGALFLALTVGLVLLPEHHQVAADPDPIIRAIRTAELFRIELWLAPFLVLSGSIAAVFALLHSQRVAGPIKRLRSSLAKLAVGDTEPLVFRRRDEFRELEEPFAGVVSRIDNLTRGRLEMLRFLRLNLEGLAQRAHDQRLPPAELNQSLSVMLRDVDAEIAKLQRK
jgi:hypothetical protein